MKATKKVISIALALVMLVATVAVAATVSASAEEKATAPVYFQRFTKENFIDYGTYKASEVGGKGDEDTKVEAKSVIYNDDGSVSISSEGEQIYGYKLRYKLDSNAKTAFARAQEIANATYQENVAAAKKKAEDKGETFDPTTVDAVAPYFSVKVACLDSTTKKGVQIDAIAKFSLVFKDGTIRTMETYRRMYHSATTKLKFQYTENSVPVIINSIDDVTEIRIEMYHWNQSSKAMDISAMVVEGDPTIPDNLPISTVKDSDGDGKLDTEATFSIWDPAYSQSYSNAPDKITYSSDGGAPFGGKVDYAKLKQTGYCKFESYDATNQKQAYYTFNMDTANYALAVANQKDGSHKLQIEVYLEKCVDKNEKDINAEVEIMLVTHSAGYVTAFKGWQKPGTYQTYTFDVSTYEQNDIYGIRPAVQNYWYYDADGNMVQYPTKKATDSDTNASGQSITYGTGVTGISINPVIYFSPVTVAPASPVATTERTTPKPTAAPTTADNNPGAGTHAYDFCEAARDKYAFAEDWCSPETHVYGADGSVTLISKNKKNKQYQNGWLIKSSTSDPTKQTILSADLSNKLYNQLKQGLAYANDPAGLGFLAIDATLNKAQNPATGKDCTMQADIMLFCKDSDKNVQNTKWVNKGQTSTLYVDVKGLTIDDITTIRLSPMNYSNTDPKTGSASGATNLDIKFSAVYVPGKGNGAVPTRETEAVVNTAEADAIYALYKQLPGTSDSDFRTESQYTLLGKFLDAYDMANEATKKYLQSKYKISIDTYGDLKQIYLEYVAGSDYADDTDTGAAAAPIAAMFVAAGAAFVIIKSRKK